jgi:hypothetical protein
VPIFAFYYGVVMLSLHCLLKMAGMGPLSMDVSGSVGLKRMISPKPELWHRSAICDVALAQSNVYTA